MSGTTGISSSAGVDYAVQLAQTSALKRSLFSLDTAVQKGDLQSAGSILTAFMKANPQYASSSTSSGSQAQDPINQHFQALADAVTSNQLDSAQSAWAQVKGDLAQNGVPALNDGTEATRALVAQSNASIDQQIVSDSLSLSTSSAGGPSLTSLLLGSSDTGSTAGLSSALLSNWLTYQSAAGTAPIATANGVGNSLNAAA